MNWNWNWNWPLRLETELVFDLKLGLGHVALPLSPSATPSACHLWHTQLANGPKIKHKLRKIVFNVLFLLLLLVLLLLLLFYVHCRPKML